MKRMVYTALCAVSVLSLAGCWGSKEETSAPQQAPVKTEQKPVQAPAKPAEEPSAMPQQPVEQPAPTPSPAPETPAK